MSHETVFGIAWEIGLDTQQFTTNRKVSSIQTIMERNRTLPRKLGINGTLRFIVRPELVPGALDLNGLKDLVLKRKNAT